METSKKLEFFEISDPTVLISVLEERHPICCMMHNQVLFYNKFPSELKFYTIGKEVNSNTWIVSNNIREDYACNYMVSAPNPMALGEQPIPNEINECIATAALFNWDNLDDVVFFASASVPISNMLVEIVANEKGNLTEVHPCYLYYMERKVALELDISPADPNIEVRRCNPSKGEEDFILTTWKYALPGSEKVIPKCLSKNASGGVFVDGKCVCGVYTPALGFLSALYTLKEHRKKGYAKLTMNYTFKEYAKDGHIPCLTVEIPNKRSIQFHEGLGLKLAAQVNGILVKKLDVD